MKKELFNICAERVKSGEVNDDRQALIKGMKKNKPTVLWLGNEFINPYFVWYFECNKGIPRDITFDELNKKGIKAEWNDWCEHWLWSLKHISHKLLFRKDYYELLGKDT